MNEKLSNAPDERKSIKYLYLNNTQLFANGQKYKKKQWAEKAAAREQCLLEPVRKQIDKTEEQS